MPPSIADLQRENERLTAQCQQLDAELTELRQRYEWDRQSEARSRAVEERTKLLSTVAQVANLLLRSQDYITVLPDVVRLLGEAVGSDRCEVFKYDAKSGVEEATMQFLSEWCSSGTLASTDIPFDLQAGFPCRDARELYEKNSVGEVANFLVDNLQDPLKRILAAQGTKAVLSVPITTADGWWGAVTFDNCAAPRLFDEAEIAILQVAAESIAAAIERQQQDEALRKSEERYRTLFELSNEGIYRVEFEPPIPLSLPVDDQVALQYEYLRVEEANKTYLEMYGLDNTESLSQIKLSDIHVEGSEKNLAFMRALVENNWRIRGYESEEIDYQGNRHYFLNNIVPDIRDGHVYGSWGTQTDITELRQALEQLQARDRTLEATADAANALLSNDNLNEAVDTALQIIGESLDADRMNIIEIEPFDQNSNLSQVGWKILNEWNSTSTVSQHLHPIYKQGDHTGIEEWLELFSSGQSASFLLEELPEPFRTGQAEIDVKAYHTVPIFLESNYWGNLGIDDCREAKRRDPAELAVLKTVAACIGSAIERDRTQKAILAAEQAKAQELQRLNTELQTSLDDIRNRDFIAETAATVANVLLREDTLQSAITQALGFLGKALSLDRVAVIEISAPSPDISSVMWHVSYEWGSSATISQINHSRLAQGTFEGIEALYEQMSSGQVISYLLEELPEPFRSGQAELGVKTLHDVPIFVADEFWGAIGFDDCHQAKRLSQTELSMLKIAADCIGSAIQRERLRLTELRTQQALLKAQQDRVAELVKTNQALKNSLDRLAATPDLDAFLGYVLTEISQQFDGKTASLHLFNPDSQTLHLHQWVAQGRVYSRQEFHQFGPLAEPITVTGSTAWAFLQQNKFPLVINRNNAHQYMFPGTEDWQLDWVEREALQAGINILLSSGETSLGMMCMYSASRSMFTSEELEIAQALSHQATLAIQLTQLAAKAQQSAILGERNRLARDIHDTLAQSLGGIVLHLQAADSIYTTDLQDKQTHVTQARQLAKQALSEARRSVQALRPQLLEQTTLDQALNSLLQQLTSHSSLQITYQLHGSPYRLPPEVEEHLLRISREAITNSLRHAQAAELVVEFTYEPRQVQLQIQDNGQGFDTTLPTFGYGLITMQERAQQISAHLHLSSQLGQGTIVQVTLPIATAVTGAFYD